MYQAHDEKQNGKKRDLFNENGCAINMAVK